MTQRSVSSSIHVDYSEPAELELLRAQLALRNCALDAAATHFMIVEAQSSPARIAFVNRALAEAHGYQPHELIGGDPARLIAIQDCPDGYAKLMEAIRLGSHERVQLRSRRRDGTTFWAGVAVSAVRNERNDVTHFVVVGTDITRKLEDERNREELQHRLLQEMKERERMAVELRFAQKLEAVGQLAAGITHEINTPVQYIGDSVLFLQSAALDIERLLETYRTVVAAFPGGNALSAARERIAAAEQTADFDFIRAEVPRAFERTLDGVSRVANIVRAIKEFAHPDRNEQSPADINHALETTLTVAGNEYKYVATIARHFGVLPPVVCNAGEINQVFLNLIVNAAHAIQQAGRNAATGVISISTAASERTVRISISDNGCGIPEKSLERIFDPFFTTKEVGKGTGQGLAIARSIVVERHGGKIDVCSREGAGTTFTIQLPLSGRSAANAP